MHFFVTYNAKDLYDKVWEQNFLLRLRQVWKFELTQALVISLNIVEIEREHQVSNSWIRILLMLCCWDLNL